MGLIIPKCNADQQTLELTLKVYYDINDWVENSTLIEQLSSALINKGIESYKKEPQSYTKKTQVLSYYGLIEWEDPNNNQSRRKITENGRKLFELIHSDNKISLIALLLSVLNSKTFGRNVLGCDSDSDLEAPNIFLKSCLLLNSINNKEFGYILGEMEYKGKELADVLIDVKIKRIKNVIIQPNSFAAKWSDPKPILALADWGLFNVTKQGTIKNYSLSNDIIEMFSNDILSLRTKNTESQIYKFHDSFEIHPLNDIDNITYPSYLTAMRTKPFLLLAGISGTGKSRIVKQMAFESCPDIPALRSDKTAPGNYELIEVKPNWHDSSELLGYESEIGGPHYVVTPFVRFLVKAMRYPDVPFFVCMDEMNLAPVEQYFAEFLSVLESRKLLPDGTITSEPLIKADIFSKYADQLHRDLDITDTETYKAVYDRLKNDGLRLPSNLIVVGTVNMDETTHQFSRKVIDRAMTIEMNIEDAETPFKNFFEGGDALHYYDNPQPKELFLPKVVQASEALSILSAEDASYLKENVPGLLHSLNSALNGTPFKIAYRVQNELILYFFSLREENPDEAAEALLAQAMDAILMMKVLPRIEGDEDLLDKPLKTLAQFTENYPQASRKIAEMQERLPQAHFTSFWP